LWPHTQAGFKNMECILPTAVDSGDSQSQMFLYFQMPPAMTSGGTQSVTFTLTAGAPL
jgi:hypothetical protein